MSISPIVDAGYRLQPSDLEGSTRRVVVSNITYQGLENMALVLHFEGQTKRLVLSAEQVAQMIEITGTPLFSRWVGVPVLLSPRKLEGQTYIELHAVTAHRRGRPMPVYTSDDKRGWKLALSVVGVLLAASSIYALLNLTVILTTIQELRANWPLR